MAHVFLTGDRHGNYRDIEQFCLKWNTSKEDLLIVLGDNGVNYWGPHKDKKLKNYLSALPISFFMIKGNHDQRPGKKLYTLQMSIHPAVRGFVWVEKEYPSLMFSEMFGSYRFFNADKIIDAFVVGGAYSADKWYRLAMQAQGYSGYRWFYDEQLTNWEMKEAKEMAEAAKPDIILSHTCPFKYIPRDMFLSQIDQSTVDDTMEHWMDTVEETVPYQKWYCGHWHTDRAIDKMRFMYHDIILLEDH